MPKFTGLSLSFCISDIMRGLVAEDDVDFLLIGTSNNSDEAWLKKIEACQLHYWRKWGLRAATVANRLRDTGKIRSPEENEIECHNIANGHWLTEKGTKCCITKLHDVQREEELEWMAAGEQDVDTDTVDWHPHDGYMDSEELGAEELYTDEAYEAEVGKKEDVNTKEDLPF